ncbi:MAG TPA: acetyltransferase [Kofleriaceae bacterium]|jgi:sugar O-acyltransferase (sialic acid O-acetyltransferase NeuD family)
MVRLVVVGSGGHAKVVIATARAAGFEVAAVADDDPARWGQRILGVEIAGPTPPVLDDPGQLAVLAIGDNRARWRLALAARCRFATVVHPGAIVDASVRLGAGTVVFAGAIVQPDTVLGAHVIVNTGASIDHDGAIDDFVHLAPGARLAGNVAIGEGGFVGIGAVAIPGVRIGAWTTVGAGAAVTGDLPANIVAAGVPARPLVRRPGP